MRQLRMLSLSVLLLAAPMLAEASVDEGSQPRLEVTTFEGDTLSLDELDGRVVLVDFWATWCGPCKKALGAYDELLETFEDDELRVIAISTDPSREDATDYVDEEVDDDTGIDFAWDEGQRLLRVWVPPTIPTAYLIGPDGRVDSRWEGYDADQKDELEGRIEALLEARVQ